VKDAFVKLIQEAFSTEKSVDTLVGLLQRGKYYLMKVLQMMK